MVLDDPKVNLLEGGWYAQFQDGSVITQAEMDWNKVPNKKNIKLMGLKRMHKRFELEGKENYCPPGETHMKEIIINNGSDVAVTKQSLVAWFIGYYDKMEKVLIKIDAVTGKVSTERYPFS